MKKYLELIIDIIIATATTVGIMFGGSIPAICLTVVLVALLLSKDRKNISVVIRSFFAYMVVLELFSIAAELKIITIYSQFWKAVLASIGLDVLFVIAALFFIIKDSKENGIIYKALKVGKNIFSVLTIIIILIMSIVGIVYKTETFSFSDLQSNDEIYIRSTLNADYALTLDSDKIVFDKLIYTDDQVFKMVLTENGKWNIVADNGTKLNLKGKDWNLTEVAGMGIAVEIYVDGQPRYLNWDEETGITLTDWNGFASHLFIFESKGNIIDYMEQIMTLVSNVIWLYVMIGVIVLETAGVIALKIFKR